jgi:hypothetical protein
LLKKKQKHIKKPMNLSQQYSSIGSENDCRSLFVKSVTLRYPSNGLFYGLLVAAAVLELVAYPFTILLNALVMVAVKTKRRLQTHPNILLACLALTDLMVGLVAQPLHITNTIFLLQGEDFHEFCDIELAFSVSLVISSFASVFHLLLINGERYLAIKHTFTHASVITKVRLMVCSALAWIAAALFLLIASYSRVMAFALIVTVFTSITLFQILVYKEARRHEKQIILQQVSVETRAKFKQEKKALKLTRIILATIFVCLFVPFFSMFVTWLILSEKISTDVKTLVRHLSLVPVIINSVLNPVIYTVRKKQFRVAFIELLLRKSLQEAEEFNRKLFGSRNNVVRLQNGQEGEGQVRVAQNENASHPNVNHEVNPVLISDDKNTAIATQNRPVSLNALGSTSKKTNEEHYEGRNPTNDKNKEEDNLEVLVAGLSSVDWPEKD